MRVGELIVSGHRPLRERLALLKVAKARRARRRRPAEVALLLRRRAQLRGRTLRRRNPGHDVQEKQRDTGNQARKRPARRAGDIWKDRLVFHPHTSLYSPPDVLGATLSATADASA